VWKLGFGDGDWIEIRDEDFLHLQLDRMWNECAQSKPRLAILGSPDGHELYIGLGQSQSVLVMTPPSGWPSRHSIGDLAESGTISFAIGGQTSEFPLSGAIPWNLAVKAAAEFFSTQSEPLSVQWENG
jgi:hypothetical protein